MNNDEFCTEIYLANIDRTAVFNSQGDIVNFADLRRDFTRAEHSYYQQIECEDLDESGNRALILVPVSSASKFDVMFNKEELLTYKILFLTGAIHHMEPTSTMFNEMRELNRNIKKWYGNNKTLTQET